MGDLAQLPGDELLVVDQEGEEVEKEAVSHVEDTANLRDDNPHQAEPPEFQSKEDSSNDIAKSATQYVTQDVLNGVT